MRTRTIVVALAIALSGCNPGTDEPVVTSPTSDMPAANVTTPSEAPVPVDGVVLDVDVTLTAADVDTAPLSEDHVDTVQQLGAPDRFALRFVGVERHETWYYDNAGFEVVFRDGVRLYAEPVPTVVVEGLGTTTLRPDQFTGGMNVDEFLAVVGAHAYVEQPLDAFDGRLVAVRGVVAGFDDTGLRYLETIPIDLD